MKDFNQTFSATHGTARVSDEQKDRQQLMFKGRDERQQSKFEARNERKEPNEDLIRHWVQKAVTDPNPGSIRHHHFGYRAYVVRVAGAASSDEVLSYSAFCRRVSAAKDYRSALPRARSKADHRLHSYPAPAMSNPEALWVQQLPASNAGQRIDLSTPAVLVTVAIAVDAVTGTVRVDSHVINAQHSDEAAVSAVQQYQQRHGRSPNAVYVDGSSFRHSPRLRRLCLRLGIELRIVFSPPQRLTKLLLSASGHQSVNEAGITEAPPTDLRKASRETIAEISRETLRPLWRRSLRDVSARRTADGALPHTDDGWQGKDRQESGEPGEEQ